MPKTPTHFTVVQTPVSCCSHVTQRRIRTLFYPSRKPRTAAPVLRRVGLLTSRRSDGRAPHAVAGPLGYGHHGGRVLVVSLAVSLLGTTDRCPQEAGTPTSSFFPPPPLGGLRPPLTPRRTSWSCGSHSRRQPDGVYLCLEASPTCRGGKRHTRGSNSHSRNAQPSPIAPLGSVLVSFISLNLKLKLNRKTAFLWKRRRLGS